MVKKSIRSYAKSIKIRGILVYEILGIIILGNIMLYVSDNSVLQGLGTFIGGGVLGLLLYYLVYRYVAV